MAKVTVLYLSFNPFYYDVKEIINFSYDEAKDFAENDTICALKYLEEELDLTESGLYQYSPDGARFGDTSDCLLMWIKVCVD